MPDKQQVAIVGFSETTRDLAPFDDSAWDIWACNHLHRYIPRADLWFELHSPKELETILGPDWTEYRDWLKTVNEPVYMQKQYEEFPSSVAFPLDELRDRFSFLSQNGDTLTPYASFKSTLSFMAAFAIMEGYKRVAIYGVDMVVDSEWGFQRHNLYYFLGWARGAGIEVIIPEKSALLKEGGFDLYAYEHDLEHYAPLIEHLRKRINGMGKQLEEMNDENEVLLSQTQGYSGICEELKSLMGETCFNGEREILGRRLEGYQRKFTETKDKNERLVDNMHHIEGRRAENQMLLERVCIAGSRGGEL